MQNKKHQNRREWLGIKNRSDRMQDSSNNKWLAIILIERKERLNKNVTIFW